MGQPGEEGEVMRHDDDDDGFGAIGWTVIALMIAALVLFLVRGGLR
jgi:hypothetical protein